MHCALQLGPRHRLPAGRAGHQPHRYIKGRACRAATRSCRVPMQHAVLLQQRGLPGGGGCCCCPAVPLPFITSSQVVNLSSPAPSTGVPGSFTFQLETCQAASAQPARHSPPAAATTPRGITRLPPFQCYHCYSRQFVLWIFGKPAESSSPHCLPACAAPGSCCGCQVRHPTRVAPPDELRQ
jgi:hypothetical protein